MVPGMTPLQTPPEALVPQRPLTGGRIQRLTAQGEGAVRPHGGPRTPDTLFVALLAVQRGSNGLNPSNRLQHPFRCLLGIVTLMRLGFCRFSSSE